MIKKTVKRKGNQKWKTGRRLTAVGRGDTEKGDGEKIVVEEGQRGEENGQADGEGRRGEEECEEKGDVSKKKRRGRLGEVREEEEVRRLGETG